MMKKWFEKRRQRRQKESYNSGFAWAMVAYHIHRIKLAEIEVLCSYPGNKPDRPDCRFDSGAAFAVNIIENPPPVRKN